MPTSLVSSRAEPTPPLAAETLYFVNWRTERASQFFVAGPGGSAVEPDLATLTAMINDLISQGVAVIFLRQQLARITPPAPPPFNRNPRPGDTGIVGTVAWVRVSAGRYIGAVLASIADGGFATPNPNDDSPLRFQFSSATLFKQGQRVKFDVVAGNYAAYAANVTAF
jgi:hypothetical protein